MSNLQKLVEHEIEVADKDGKLVMCTPYATPVKGGKAVVYLTQDGQEVKREPLTRYLARETRAKAMKADLEAKVKEFKDGESIVTGVAELEEKIKTIVEAIVFDIQDRRGIKHKWNSIDEAIQDEIKEKWGSIIRDTFKK